MLLAPPAPTTTTMTTTDNNFHPRRASVFTTGSRHHYPMPHESINTAADSHHPNQSHHHRPRQHSAVIRKRSSSTYNVSGSGGESSGGSGSSPSSGEEAPAFHEQQPTTAATAASTTAAVPRIRNGCSLDRNSNQANGRSAREGRLALAQKECANEKIIMKSDCVQSLPSRAAFYRLYEIGGRIGRGNFSDVFSVLDPKSSAKYAVKEIDKQRLNGKAYFVENEVALLKRVQHPAICRLLDAYETEGFYFLVFEYAPKGDLFETIKRMGRLSERASAHITLQLASALAYLHARRIVHRDVKAENILIAPELSVKLTDFGLACTVLWSLYRVCGTPTYVAPEVLSQSGYGLPVDVWSLGVLLYVMLAGHAPFRCTNRIMLFKLIMRGRLSFDMPQWSRVSGEAKQLLGRMITVDVHSRMSAAEVAESKWVVEHTL